MVLNSKGPTDADDGEETAGGILNGLRHVHAEVMHLGGLVSGPTVSPAFTAACPTRIAENLVAKIMTLRGPATATKHTFLTLHVDTIPGTPVPGAFLQMSNIHEGESLAAYQTSWRACVPPESPAHSATIACVSVRVADHAVVSVLETCTY